MILGIDATNIRGGGGGVTHLVELLRAADPAEAGIDRVHVWGATETLDRLEARPWLTLTRPPELDAGLVQRTLWQHRHLADAARSAACDVLLVLSGSYAGDFSPFVVIHQNLLPFEWQELARYGVSSMTARLIALRVLQSRTIRRASGAIYLSEHARRTVSGVVGGVRECDPVIPHGIDERFFRNPRTQSALTAYSFDRPFRVLYVSIIDVYKHQGNVARAVAALRAEGLPLALDLIGPAYAPALRRLESVLREVDPSGQAVRYHGAVAHSTLPNRFAEAHLGVFASTCETFGQILTEAMAGGLPIACANRSAMPELLGDAGEYFDPERPSDIARSIRTLAQSPSRRAELARAAFQRARQFTWAHCASRTLSYLAEVGWGNSRSTAGSPA